jgi:hypothetical protein
MGGRVNVDWRTAVRRMGGTSDSPVENLQSIRISVRGAGW